MSYALYVGGRHTADGVAFLAGYGDEPSSHWLELVPRRRHPDGATVVVGATAEADLPGLLSEIPQAAETARHLTVGYSYYKGTPAPLTNGGLNEHGVAVRDVWSPSRPELVAMTPPDQSGPNYSDLSRLVLERARTAREGVELIGALIARHGHVSYGGNSHLIADPDEAWVVIEFAGGRGLWVAERLGPEALRVSRPGYIGAMPHGGDGGRDWLHSPDFFAVAAEQGWHEGPAGAAFDVNAVYGDGRGRWAGVAWLEEQLQERAARPEKVGLHDVVALLRDGRITGDTAGYGQVVPLAHPAHDALRLVWHAQIGPVAAPFTPVFLGVSRLPEEYGRHRYLGAGESSRFIDPRHPEKRSAVPQGVEASRSATRVFKRLQYLAFQRGELFLPELHAVWQAEERRLAEACPDIARLAALAIEAGEAELAGRHLTWWCAGELLRALELGARLADALEIRLRALPGFDPLAEPSGPEQLW